VFDTQQAMTEAAMQTALEIAARPPVAIWATKQAIDYARDHPVADGLRQMGWLQSGLWDTAAVAEAIQARAERREAEFPDLRPLRYFSD
jgi:enoyl-CoA hydratase